MGAFTSVRGLTSPELKAAAEQLNHLNRWGCLLSCISDRITLVT
jgi:hypothetical protein